MPEKRKLAAILLSDIVGYSRFMSEDEEYAFQLLKKNRQLQTMLIEKYDGEWLKEIGDGVLASFPSATQAVLCAQEIQLESRKEPDLKLRIGICLGDVIFEDGDVFGDGVNIASLLEPLAPAGGIYISESVFWNIDNKKGIEAVYVKEKKLKHVKIPIKIYEVRIKEDKDSPKLQRKARTKIKPIAILSGIIILALLFALIFHLIPGKQIDHLEKSIAVRPFWNESTNEENEYFVNGVTEEIRNNLSKISGLQVRSRGSIEKYRNTDLSTKRMAKELNVTYVLEGTIQRVGNHIKIHTQLILAEDDYYLWDNVFERDLKDAKEIFNLQSEIAHAVAEELKIIVTPQEKEIIESIPTDNLQAYEFYLKGEDYRLRSYEENDYKFAIGMYEKAIEADPYFVLPWVGLAAASRSIYWFYYNRSEDLLSETKGYLDKAISLSPNSKEVMLEEGNYYYMCERDYARAIKIFEQLKSDYPNDDDHYFWISMVYRRMGSFRKSFEYNEHAISLNPTYWLHWLNAGLTLQTLKQYTESENYQKKVMELNPSVEDTFWYLLVLYCLKGELEKAQELSRAKGAEIDRLYARLIRSNIEIYIRDFDEAIRIIESIGEGIINDPEYYGSKNLQLGLIYYLMSDEKMSVKYFEAERILLEGKIAELKYDPRIYRSLGIVYAGLGMKQKAIEYGRKGNEILGFNKDAISGFYAEMDMARILLMTGDYNGALSILEFLFEHTGYISTELLRIDPFWDPLRDLERYKKMILKFKYQDVQANQ